MKKINKIKHYFLRRKTVTMQSVGLLATALFDKIVTTGSIQEIENILIPWLTAAGLEIEK